MRRALPLVVLWCALVVGLHYAMSASAACAVHVKTANVTVTICVTTLRPGACRMAIHEYRHGVETKFLRTAIPCIRKGELIDPGDRRPL